VNEIRFVPTTRQNLMFLPLFLIIAAEQLVLGRWVFAAVYNAVMASLVTLLRAKMGSTISSSGIELRSFSRQRIAWQQIRFIEVRNLMGTSVVRLHLFDGKKRRLRAPYTGFMQKDPDFVAKVNTIQQWWMHYTGQIQPPVVGQPYQWPSASGQYPY